MMKPKLSDYMKNPQSRLNLPMPIYALLTLKTDEDRISYLKSLPTGSLESVATAIMYAMLKANLLDRALKLGIAVPEKAIGFIRDIETKVKEKGELTVSSVKAVIKNVTDISLLILTVSIAVFLITNPVLFTVVWPVLGVIEFISLFSSDKKERLE